MNSHHYIYTMNILAVACTLLAACSTTGDPTQGGIFWSPDKAMTRRQELMAEQATRQAEYNKLNRTATDYSRTRDNLVKKTHEGTDRPAAAPDLKNKDSIDAARKAIEAELENM